jgi:hypothetical protein
MSEPTENTEDWQARAAAAEAEIARVRNEAQARIVQAELKAEAVRAGMVDLDGLKLISPEEIRLTEAGEVADAQGLLARLKRGKPWLFGGGGSSSVMAQPPRPEPPRTRHANELSHEEWLSARAALVRRR